MSKLPNNSSQSLTEPEYLRALDNDYYRIFLLGHEIWNRWVVGHIDHEYRARHNLPGWPRLSSGEEAEILTKSRLSALPDPTLVNFDCVAFDTQVDFANYIFPSVSFRNTAFRHGVIFSACVFGQDAMFIDTKFCSRVHFRGVRFVGSPAFDRSTSEQVMDFSACTFEDYVDFGDAVFGKGAVFYDVKFQCGATFQATQFKGHTTFNKAKADARTDFGGAVFSGPLFMRDCTFQQDSNFAEAHFAKGADFSHSIFKGPASFEHANFGGVADFSDARFCARTSFVRTVFSESPFSMRRLCIRTHLFFESVQQCARPRAGKIPTHCGKPEQELGAHLSRK